jgi:hypothetical protein
LNNRAENSHLPTRKRERILQLFKSACHAHTRIALFLQVDEISRYQAGAPLQAQLMLTALTDATPAGPPQTHAVSLQSIAARLDGMPMARVTLSATVPVRIQLKVNSNVFPHREWHFWRKCSSVLRSPTDNQTQSDS